MDDVWDISGSCKITLIEKEIKRDLVEAVYRDSYGKPIFLKTIDGNIYNWNFIVSIEKDD